MSLRLAVSSLLAILAWTHTSVAQTVDVYSNPDNKKDNIVSFGATRPQPPEPVSRTIIVVNGYGARIRITPSFEDIGGAHANGSKEFGGLGGAEILENGATRDFRILHLASYSEFPNDTVARAKLVVRVEEEGSQALISRFEFLLIGVKTAKLLGTDATVVNFDSVLITPTCSVASGFKFFAVSKESVSIRQQKLTSITPFLGKEEIVVATYPSVTFNGISNVSWGCSYKPVDVGPDVADFSLKYENPNDLSDTSVRAACQGIGVQHSLDPIQTRVTDASGTPCSLRGDTIDIGYLPEEFDSVRVSLSVQNFGSIAVGVDSLSIQAKHASEGSFILNRGLPKALRANAVDSVSFTFIPKNVSSMAVATLRVHTNLGRRPISCVPPSAVTREFIVVARNRPALRSIVDTIEFGSIVKPVDCEGTKPYALTVRNYSMNPCVIDSIRINPIGGSVQVLLPPGSIIPPNSAIVIDCQFLPQRIGNEVGTLTLWLNTPQGRLDVPYRGRSVAPSNVALRIDDSLRARPGSTLRFPVRVDAEDLRAVEFVSFSVDYNPTLLQCIDVRQDRTASKGALVGKTEHARGVTFTIERDAGLFPSDTLIELDFSVFLGDSAWTLLSLASDAAVGTKVCRSVFPVLREHGRFSLDSVCGLAYKTRGVKPGLKGAMFPSPASDHVTLMLQHDASAQAVVMIVDAFGRECQQIVVPASTGMSLTSIDTSRLASGQYSVFVQCDGFTERLSLLVSQ